MTITAHNYTRDAEKALYALAMRFVMHFKPDESALLLRLYDQMRAAVNFALPDTGRFFDDGLLRLHNKPLRLPFPVVTLEYHRASELEGVHPDKLPMSRRVIIAEDYEAEGESGISLHCMNYSDSESAWAPDLLGLWIPCAWEVWHPEWPTIKTMFPEYGDTGANAISCRTTKLLPGAYDVMVSRLGPVEAQRHLMRDIASEVTPFLEFCDALADPGTRYAPRDPGSDRPTHVLTLPASEVDPC